MDKKIIAIGGGEIKNKTTLKIDEYVSNLAKAHAGEKRAVGLFIGTASHDSMPYFNSFRKTYTSNFDLKAEVALIVYGEMDMQKIQSKIDMADVIYIGGGNTKFMLEKWQETGLTEMIINAYNQGKIICGLSAGAICWFTDMFTDYAIMSGESNEYTHMEGLGIINGMMCPHFNERESELESYLNKNGYDGDIFGVENNCAIEFTNGVFDKVISAGGKAYKMVKKDNTFVKEEL
jgi:dipeptidase E